MREPYNIGVPLPDSGFQALHPDRNINFQLNRALFEGRLEDLRPVAPRIRDYADWNREMLALARTAEGEGRALNAFAYYRAAEFFMDVDDPDRLPTVDKFIALLDGAHPGLDRRLVPFRDGVLPAFVLPGERGTILLHGGFDSYIEEFYEIAAAFAARGYRVIAFDGPGQGTARARYGLTMDAAWEQPVGAILDHFAVDDVTLIGISLGGYLAVRAAAYEPRVRRVVAFDVLADFFRCMVSRKGRAVEVAMRALIAVRAAPLVNAFSRIGMRIDLLMAWGIARGMYLTGMTTPYDMFRVLKQFHTRDCSPLVRQDVLVLAGEDDHFVPLAQYYDQLRALVHARSVTGRLFTRAEGAAEHCQFGNVGLALETIATWIATYSTVRIG
jgi:pimeloyl-ACP methyl ester carboxylesterase